MSIFTKEEQDEIFELIEATKNENIDGIDITCFKSVYSIISGEKKMDAFSTTELNDYLVQLNLLYDVCQCVKGGDCSLLEKLIAFLEKEKN